MSPELKLVVPEYAKIEDGVSDLPYPRQCQALMVSWYYTVRCSYATRQEWKEHALCGIHRRPGVVVTEEF